MAQEGSQIYFHSDLEREYITQFVNNSEYDLPSLYLMVDESLDQNQLASNKVIINEWVAYFKKKQQKFKNDRSFLSHLFYKVHRKVLKNYKQYTYFNETLSENTYDCLSATTLYATLLSKLDINFSIIETNYHIYLNVELHDNKTILLESTDPINGFIEDQSEIDERLKAYVKANNASNSKNGEYSFKESIHASVSSLELIGLQYYNASVKAFNAGDLYTATTLLEKGVIFYHSSRFEELGMVLAQSLLADDKIETRKKRQLLAKIPYIRKGNKEIVGLFN